YEKVEQNDRFSCRAKPISRTDTILTKIFKEKQVEISATNAKLLVSAIISDTLLFNSPTCTNEDKQAAKELADIAGIDLDTYGLDMLKAGTDLSDKSVAELIHMDAKEFTMGEAKVEIAQINTIDTEEVYKKQADFETEINKQ